MSNFQNLKIAITPEQPLDEVVRELERLGYKNDEDSEYVIGVDEFIHTYINGCFDFFMTDLCWGELTTLTELKEME